MAFPVLSKSRDILARYPVIISDVWGVVHDGITAHADACDALIKARAGGACVVLLSNFPGSGEMAARVLDAKGVPPGAWDGLVTSGDITRRRLVASGVRRIFHIGSHGDDEVYDGLRLTLVGEEEAQMVVATELRDYYTEQPEEYRPLLKRLAARGLPFLCGNPDYVVHVGEDLLPCAGALALIYEELGGEVFWAGKPHRPAFEAALAEAARLRGKPASADERVLMIGDTVRTDLAGAAACGFDALFVIGGVHRDETMPGGVINEDAVRALCEAAGLKPVAATSSLVW
ncbi:MAG: TIGR01459 family HAD-type hydrolase [Bosea sp. (in: a-proteobacteria)]